MPMYLSHFFFETRFRPFAWDTSHEAVPLQYTFTQKDRCWTLQDELCDAGEYYDCYGSDNDLNIVLTW